MAEAATTHTLESSPVEPTIESLARRAFVTGVIAASVVTSVAAAQGDPIFSAIDRHRRAWDASLDTLDEDGGLWSGLEEEAFAFLAATTPTTPAGIAALAAYMVEKDDESIYDDRYGCLARAIERGALHLIRKT